MNAEDTFNSISDLRAWLEGLGVTTQGLVIVALMAAVFFIFSLREVLSWYFKVQHLRSEVRQMRDQMHALQKSLDHMHDLLLAKETTPVVSETPVETQTASSSPAVSSESKRFNFDH